MDCPDAEKVEKMWTDMYHGDARKPGLTTRMEQAENRDEEQDKRMDTVDGKFWAIILLLVTLLGSVAFDLLARKA